MAYSAITIANRFVELAERDGKSLTNMQVQKLVYIAHGFYLAYLGQPLFYEIVEAWDWGPVVRPLYHALRQYGSGYVTEPISGHYDITTELSRNATAIVEKVWQAYGKYGGVDLSNITHRPNSPWARAKEQQNPYISNDNIMAYYRGLINERVKPQPTAAEHV